MQNYQKRFVEVFILNDEHFSMIHSFADFPIISYKSLALNGLYERSYMIALEEDEGTSNLSTPPRGLCI